VVANISAVAYPPAVVSGHDIAVILMLLVAGITVVACVTACCCLHLVCGRHSCRCWRPVSSRGLPVAGLSAFDGVLAVASVPADPDVPNLASGFTYWIFG
jgi:hypothetical protein